MPRIPIIERADMNAEQARVYDAAKKPSRHRRRPVLCLYPVAKIVRGRPELARIAVRAGRCRSASSRSSTSSSPGIGTRATRGSRKCAARFPSASIRPSSTRSTRTRRRTCPMRARKPALPWRGIAGEQGRERRNLCRRGKGHGAGKPGRAGRLDRQFFDDLHDRRHLRHRAAGRQSDAAVAIGYARLNPVLIPDDTVKFDRQQL